MRTLWLQALIFVVSLVMSGVVFADSESTLGQMLKKSGLRVGYDQKEKRFVAIGVAERQIASPATNPKFDKIRSDLSKAAYLNAKKEVMFWISAKAIGKDRTESVSINGDHTTLTVSIMELFSKMSLRGCKVLCSAESWDPAENLFQVSVAVGWSEKAADVANKVMVNSASMDVAQLDDDDPEWEDWGGKNDLSTMVGCRQFTDSQGRVRYLGIGAANVEGVTGLKLKSAMRRAGLNALECLVLSLCSDTAARDVATQYLKDMESSGGSRNISWDQFSSEVMARCKMPIMAHEVYSVTKPHPITGAKMYISVYGVAIK